MGDVQAKLSRDCLLVHYDEIGLKGKNRPWFEQLLSNNLRQAAGAIPTEVRWLPGRFLVFASQEQLPALAERLRRVPGVASVSPARHLPLDLELLEREGTALAAASPCGSFAVRAVRQDKRLPFRSQDVAVRLGAAIQSATGRRVDLSRPDWTLHAEILSKEAILYHARIPGSGGLPVGSAGTALCLLSGGIDSPVAAYQLMKRGCRVHFLHCHSFPFVQDRSSQEKCRRLVERLDAVQGRGRLWLAAIGDEQQRIVTGAPPKYRTLLYRRLMVRTAERLALRHRWDAVATGDSLGQVASQTLPNLYVVERGLALPLLRPLLAMNKSEIIRIAREIGTFDVTLETQEDCCRFLEPAQVETRARAAEFERIEGDLRMDEAAARVAEQAVEAVAGEPSTSPPARSPGRTRPAGRSVS